MKFDINLSNSFFNIETIHAILFHIEIFHL
jgi:hypothetical protein